MSNEKKVNTEETTSRLQELQAELGLFNRDGEFVKSCTQSTFVKEAVNERDENVGDVARFLQRPYRQIFGIAWRARTGYKQPAKS